MRRACFQCGNRWGECTCTIRPRYGFEFEGYTITDPTVSVCGRYYVDPRTYYGAAYEQAQQWLETEASKAVPRK